MELKNKRILVTRGGSGMGRELILALLERGCYVIAVELYEIDPERAINVISPVINH